MKAQIYDDGTVRVFAANGGMLCDVHADKPLKPNADAGLRLIRMARVGKWKHYRAGGFYEATVRFMPARKPRPADARPVH